MKEKLVAKIVDYGLVFIAIMSIVINSISFYALRNSEYEIIPWLPVIIGALLIVLAIFRKRVPFNTKAILFILTLMAGASFSLSIGLLDIASLWFVTAIIYTVFIDKKKALYVFLFSFFSMLIVGVLMMMKLPNFPIDYKFDSCQFACVAIRIVNFFIFGYLIYHLLRVFLSTIDLYIDNLSEKNTILEKLNAALKNEMQEKINNEQLKANLSLKEQELDNKRIELAEITMKMISFNKLLRQIGSCVANQDYGEAKKIIRFNIYSDYNWQRFKLSFREVYPNFLDNLQNSYPKLTDNEIKLSAFLLMKIKTKDIAEIMGVSDSAVSKNRNRLRKKLNIESERDFSLFLENYTSKD